jgi:hypothetical protein
VLLFALVETHDGFRDLTHQVAPVVRRDQVQFQREIVRLELPRLCERWNLNPF